MNAFKKIFLMPVCVMSFAFFSQAKELQGDQANACGALLCLAGGMMSGECAGYISKYFSIQMEKPWQTLAARKNFLNLCPQGQAPSNAPILDNPEKYGLTQNNDDYTIYLEMLSNLDEDCTQATLNRVEKRTAGKNGFNVIYEYRINPNPTKSCKLLTEHKYSNKSIHYTCKNTQFYSEEDWNNGYTKKFISKQEYDQLASAQRGMQIKEKSINYIEYHTLLRSDPQRVKQVTNYDTNDKKSIFSYFRLDTLYFQKMPIEKNCWEVKDKLVYN
ncbi:TrbM/KikA/MpfK family conjugal transfer protein [Campylobacter sp. MIT 97-5078]|uniref:TrbM/KikA/MpfK family conjugal transfer protein n=1 Tax=Campylobacter sp. MIT 97-5078 TaxID=1548153 RepID=UPI0005139D9B|nr:TrbM/KikA/MpfK family conjugal transfer protein [Campylobacter sp. MIT 97-5078]KGI55186.1 hypothetical protein LR59_13050 [Campylobacter sp. MIT 97-5078]TQR23049.1 hypothetical protein DMB91_08425 [Campylobacter sp. MIT 97-5078]